MTIDLNLITPHGDWEPGTLAGSSVQKSLLITPHGDWERRQTAYAVMRHSGILITPHGDWEPLRCTACLIQYTAYSLPLMGIGNLCSIVFPHW